LFIAFAFRKKASLTQNELSKLTGLSQSYVNKIENLIAEPPYSVAKKIIELLNDYKNVDFDVKLLMTKIRTVSSKNTIGQAMSELNVSQLPVINDGLIVGSITKKTIPKLIKKGVKNIESQLISDVMDSPFPMIPDGSKVELISLLLEFNEAV